MLLHGAEHGEFECLGIAGIAPVDGLAAVSPVSMNPLLDVRVMDPVNDSQPLRATYTGKALLYDF